MKQGDSFLGKANTASATPFLDLLPSYGPVSELEKFNSSFFARHEKAVNLKAALSAEGDADNLNHLSAEIEMLRAVLDWLNSVNMEKL